MRVLSAEVAALEGELAIAHEDIAAFEGHLDDVKGAVGDIRAQFDALETLVETDPRPAHRSP